MKSILTLFTFTIIFGLNLKCQIDSTKALSIESITSAVLESLTHKADEESNWEQMSYFFLPSATLTVVLDVADGKDFRQFSLEEFIKTSSENTSEYAFEEIEIGKTYDEFNGIAQVFQSYEVISGEYKQKGINSYQLIFDGNRWWITSIVWSGESSFLKIPNKYLYQK